VQTSLDFPDFRPSPHVVSLLEWKKMKKKMMKMMKISSSFSSTVLSMVRDESRRDDHADLSSNSGAEED